ncbi:MAG: hypothetical protein H0V41_12310 [Pseudonocardiales bacterium]|nr:hypothetical protein [Pseudonocardiales bacterium]
MATTKPNVKHVQIERVQFWADDRGEIHIVQHIAAAIDAAIRTDPLEGWRATQHA